MLRETIADQVKSITPHDELEEDHQQAVLHWIASGEELFRTKKPNIPERHLVAYFAVVDPEADKILLQDHRLAKLWLPPGGHVDPGENPIDTVKRECQEELGLEAEFLGDPKPVFVTVTRVSDHEVSHTDISLWFILKAEQTAALRLEKDKVAGVQWWQIDDILGAPIEKFDPHLHRFCNKLRILLKQKQRDK